MSNTPSLPPGEDLYWRLHSLSKILEGSGLIDQSQHPDAYATILDAMAFVRGTPQPVVREPLTDGQLVEAFCTTAGLNPRQMVGCFVAGARFAERHNGITQKGGQHGSDN